MSQQAQPWTPSDMAEQAPSYRTAAVRRTRFVCVSDTHNSQVKLPRGDVLIHAGDLTNQGSYSELARAVAWLEKADFECKIVVAGNHDVTLDRAFYAEHGARFHNQSPQSPDACVDLLASSPTITYLCHESTSVCLKRLGGPQTRFTVFGSPYSPQSGTWAFPYGRTGWRHDSSRECMPTAQTRVDPLSSEYGIATDQDIWSTVPAAVDVMVTHTPPFAHCDWSTTMETALGCEELRQVLSRVRPRLAVCGHVHEARGAERILWKPSGWRRQNAQERRGVGENTGNGCIYAPPALDDEEATEYWEDPGQGKQNEKLSLVDLTSRRGQRSLDNDGSMVHPSENGRHETCVVNCAIMANNYPHVGGKKFNKPVVVDLDLPTWNGRAS